MMGVYYSLTYGVALTDQFGYRLKHIPQELFDFGKAEQEKRESDVISSMPTEEDYAIVLGIGVAEGPEDGATWVEGEDFLKTNHQHYLKVLAKCPSQIQALVKDHALVPRLCVLAGDF